MAKFNSKTGKFFLDRLLNTRNILIAFALLLIAVTTSALLVKISADNESRNLYLYNADSITTLSFSRDLFSGGKLDWSMSTQIFIFPELPLVFLPYLIASFFNNMFLAQVINSFLTVGLLAVVMYLFARYVLHDRIKSYIFMLISLGLFTLMAASEDFLSSVASISFTLLINTYYYGAILTTILGLLFTLIIVDKTDNTKSINALLKRKRLVVASTLLSIFIGLSLASDGLYIVWFFLPLLIALFVLFVLNSISRFQLFINYLILSAGYALSKIFIIISDIAGISQKNEGGFIRYISIARIPESLSTLKVFITINHLQFEILIILLLILLSFVFIVSYVYRLSRNKIRTNNARIDERTPLAINLFIIIVTIVTLSIFFIAGSIHVLRYLSVLAFISILTLLPILKIFNKRIVKWIGVVTIIATTILSSAVLLINVPKSRSLINFDKDDGTACVVKYLNNVDAGQAQYATTGIFYGKTLDYYRDDDDLRVIDSWFGNKIEDADWLNNKAVIKEKNTSNNKLNYIVLTDETDITQNAPNVANVAKLIPAKPTDIHICHENNGGNDRLIYYYETDSEGWKYLNNIKSTTP